MKRLIAAAGMLVSATAGAEPIVGTAMDYGGPLAQGEGGRMGLGLYVAGADASGWAIGGELAGGVESHLGGYGCGTMGAKPGEAVPAVAVACFEPSLALHLVIGRRLRLGDAWLASAELGVGATAVFAAQPSLESSGLARASLLFAVGEELGGEWWTGVQVSERIIDGPAPRAALSLGWVLEASVID